METMEEARRKGLEHLGNAIDKFQNAGLTSKETEPLESFFKKWD